MTLAIRDLHVAYGATSAVRGIDLDVPANGIVSVLGHNGAGKSSTLRAVAGLVRPVSGTLTWRGDDLLSVPAHARPGKGVVLVPEGRQLVPQLSVRDTLLSAGPRGRRNTTELAARVDRELDRFPVLRERSNQSAGSLSGGEAQMLAISRALMKDPQLLMLDEPSLGLAPLVVQRLVEVLGAFRDQGMSVLLVEQAPELAIAVADTVVVVERGEVVRTVSGDEARATDIVSLMTSPSAARPTTTGGRTT